MGVRDTVEWKIMDAYAGYLGGLGRVDHTSSGLGVGRVTLPTKVHPQWGELGDDVSLRLDVLASWIAALQDGMTVLAEEVEKLRKPAASG